VRVARRMFVFKFFLSIFKGRKVITKNVHGAGQYIWEFSQCTNSFLVHCNMAVEKFSGSLPFWLMTDCKTGEGSCHPSNRTTLERGCAINH